VLPKITYFHFSITGLSQLKLSHKKKNRRIFFKNKKEIFNGDKSRFKSFSKDWKILSIQGDRNVYEIDKRPYNSDYYSCVHFLYIWKEMTTHA
jgi:hypothetical protein